jgi:hypothetical protein
MYNSNGGTMYKCEQCDKEFKTFQGKANHVRWKHNDKPFTDEGYKRLVEAGKKLGLYETVECPVCSTPFKRKSKPNSKGWMKRTCSRSCGNVGRKLSEDSRRKQSEAAMKNPEYIRWIGSGAKAAPNRFSSKLERKLAELLGEGFQRHYNVSFKGQRLDFDIASQDGRFLVECDGIWHFEKVHDGHNFERVQMMDKLKEEYATENNLVLIRLDNRKLKLNESYGIIRSELKNDCARVVKYY